MDKKNFYFKFFLLFLLFGSIIAFFVYYFNNVIITKKYVELKKEASVNYFLNQNHFLENLINDAKYNINSIISTEKFQNYINESNNLKEVTELFYAFSASKRTILQLRYINIEGDEIIRIQKYPNNSVPEVIFEDKLQNKSHSEYFYETINLAKSEFYISKFDLNKEYNNIQKPFQPTIRVIKNVYDKNNNKKGMVAINLDMRNFIDSIKIYDDFDIYIVDSKGNYLVHPDINKQWSSDLKTGFNLKDLVSKDLFINILNKNEYHSNFLNSYSLENSLNNKQNLKIIFISKNDYLEEILKETNIKLFGSIIPIITFLGLLVAVYPTKIRKDLIDVVELSKEKEEIINEFIPISISNENGIIFEVNDAFCNLTGYRKDELIGFSHNKLKSGKISDEVYNELWDTIKSGNMWFGELENKKKNGQRYWIETIIKPKIDEKTNELQFTAISRNITDKKLTEELAKTDHLTNLANRSRIDEELEKAIYNVKRYNSNISIMMLDIDHFKNVNDKFGHTIGDSVLIEFSNILKSSIRKSDLAGRWGGEEFIIICYETKNSEIAVMAENIRKRLENMSLNLLEIKLAVLVILKFHL